MHKTILIRDLGSLGTFEFAKLEGQERYSAYFFPCSNITNRARVAGGSSRQFKGGGGNLGRVHSQPRVPRNWKLHGFNPLFFGMDSNSLSKEKNNKRFLESFFFGGGGQKIWWSPLLGFGGGEWPGWPPWIASGQGKRPNLKQGRNSNSQLSTAILIGR